MTVRTYLQNEGQEDRKTKTLIFGIMEGTSKRGEPHREWPDDNE